MNTVGLKKKIVGLKAHVLPLLFLLLIPILINFRHLNEPPAYIHAWTQSDNYSLALGFQHNGGDLFHPQTLIFNKQQKGFDDPESLITACDLPLHHWIVSLVMSVTDCRQPWVFRGMTLAVAIIGLWALYFLTFLLTHSRAKSLLVSLVTATAPSYAYYSASFLPTVPALSLAMGGLLFYVLHLKKGKTWMLWVGILLLSLSMMSRTSFAVLWVAVTCFQLLRFMRHETQWRSWLPFVAGAALYVLWWLWSYHLRQQYGSLFLSSLLPVHSWEDACYVFQNMHDRWRFHYFQRMQHWLYVVVALAAVITLWVNRKKTNKAHHQLSLWWLLLIWFLGEILFVMAMFQQFCDHDYYFLDSLFLPIVMLLVGLLGIVPNPAKLWGKIMALLVVLLLSGFMTAESCKMQRIRRMEGVEALQTAVRYKSANHLLEESGYGSKELRFLTLFSYPQNTPFVMMDREGYAVMWTNPEIVNHALAFDFDYILVEDEVYRKEFENAPVLSRLQRLAGNGEISVCALSDSVLHPVADDFFR